MRGLTVAALRPKYRRAAVPTPVSAVAEYASVEIRAQDLLLRVVVPSIRQGEQASSSFRHGVVVAVQVEPLGELLADRARALREGQMRHVVGELRAARRIMSMP